MSGQLAPQPPGPLNLANHLRAWADRHNLARDVFARLVVATGAMATVDVATGDVTITANPTTNAAEFDALRYLAQVAVNVVDYTDADDFHTPFVWNPSSGVLREVTNPVSRVRRSASSFMNPTISTSFVASSCTTAGTSP